LNWLHTHRYWLARRVTQVGILLLFWLGAHRHLGVLTGNLSGSQLFRTVPMADPFAVLQILATGQPLANTVLLGAALVLLFYLLVGGRSYCAWVCPVNLVTDSAGWFKRRFNLKGQFRVARGTRFWIMGLALLLSAITGVAAFEWISPIGLIHRELIFGPGLGLSIIAVVVLVDLYVAGQGWCGSLCPLGAFYSLVGRFALLRVGFVSERCDRCGDCLVVCPEKHVLDFSSLETKGFIDSGDCLNCSRCLEVCPRDACHLTLRPLAGAAKSIKRGDRHATQNAA
jgi:ferredoxin-type protein NapH